MPRLREGIRYEDTYAYLIQKSGYEVILRSDYSNDTQVQASHDNLTVDVEYFRPNAVVIQLGIVDCAPRLFSKREAAMINHLPKFLRSGIIAFLSKHRFAFTKQNPKVYVGIDDFRTNMQHIINFTREHDAVPVIVNIARPPAALVERSYGILDNVKAYNIVLRDLAEANGCDLVDLYSTVEENPDRLLDDGIHLGKEGHVALASAILAVLRSKKMDK